MSRLLKIPRDLSVGNEILIYSLIFYLGVGLLASLIGFLILITNRENREDIARRGLLNTLLAFIRVAIEWPLLVLDMISIRRSIRKIKKNWDGLLNKIEEDIDAKERNDTRKH